MDDSGRTESMMPNSDLKGKVALITGGASGIGRGITEAFAAEGARVVFSYQTSAEAAQAIAGEIQAKGGEALAIASDLTREEQADALVETVIARFGRLDTLVANAGGLLQRQRIENCSLELWNQALAVNLTSTFLICRAALPHLKRTKGTIVTMTSLAAHDGGGAGAGHYATAKGGVSTFTRALAKEVGPFGIRVNGIAPGLIATQFHDRFSTPEGRQATVQRTALGREGTASDVAGVAVFLASSLSSFMTGEIIEVNGGQGFY
jgi:3-oxoacyl-[acyl-carrier protein] reductase